MMKKKILYIDMDNVLVDFKSGIAQLDEKTKDDYENNLDDVPGIFGTMKPVEGAVEAYHELSRLFDTYVLSTAPWKNPSAWSDKLLWVKKYIGDPAWKRLIISHHKNLNRGDFLVDDRPNNGAKDFKGEWIHFSSEEHPNWASVLEYLQQKV